MDQHALDVGPHGPQSGSHRLLPAEPGDDRDQVVPFAGDGAPRSGHHRRGLRSDDHDLRGRGGEHTLQRVAQNRVGVETDERLRTPRPTADRIPPRRRSRRGTGTNGRSCTRHYRRGAPSSGGCRDQLARTSSRTPRRDPHRPSAPERSRTRGSGEPWPACASHRRTGRGPGHDATGRERPRSP
jgi:hypothetical protein